MAFRVVANSSNQILRNTRGINATSKTTIRRISSAPVNLNNTPITKVSTLPSGLRVATGSGAGDIATIGVWLDVGSARENDKNYGINYFLHNLLLQGGSRPNLDKDVDSIGANITGYSDRETTAIYGQAHKNDVPKFVEILGDVVQGSNFKREDVELVRRSVINVHRESRNIWDSGILSDYVHAAAYQGSSHASAVIGEPDIITSLKEEDLSQFHKKFYTARNVVVVGTGSVKHEELEQLASKNFSHLSALSNAPFPRVNYVGSEIKIRDDCAHTVKSVIAWEAVGRTHPHYWTYLLLQTFVGQWSKDSVTSIFSSSRWAEEIALNRFAHNYHSVFKPYNSTGLFEVYFESTPENQEDTVYLIFNEFQKLATYITPEELERAKNQLKVSLLAHLEDPRKYAKLIGKTVLSANRALGTAEYFARIDAITQDDIADVLSTFFTDVDPILVAYGNVEDYPDYNIVRGWTYWTRW